VRRFAAAVGCIGLAALAGCASKKAELIYEEPVTNVWSGAGQQRPQQQPPPEQQQAPPQANPNAAVAPAQLPPANVQPANVPPQGQAYPAPNAAPAAYPTAAPSQAPAGVLPPAAKAPLLPSQYPYPHNYPPPAQATQQPMPPAQEPEQPQPPPQGAWGRQRVNAPQAPPTGFPDQSVTTTVVPNNDPTTQTTLKKKGGWVRGGYD